MTKVNLKDNIFIEGFDDINKFLSKENKYNVQNTLHFLKRVLIYSGKTSEIPEELEELAENIDTYDYWNESACRCQERATCYYCQEFFDKNDLQKVCDKEYCIIYKTK